MDDQYGTSTIASDSGVGSFSAGGVSSGGTRMNVATLMKRPSAFVPIAMSVGALATVGVHIALFGVAPQADEGTAAHIFQLLIALQVPIVAYFAITSLPHAPRQA